MAASEIAFGTSGVRGPAKGFTSAQIAAYTRAFLTVCCPGQTVKDVVVAQDFRASSPGIANAVAGSIIECGWRPINAGTVPTPALAAYALGRGLPAIMVTGSHTPADQNGLKFYRPEGELLKADEAPIRAAAKALRTQPEGALAAPEGPALPAVSLEVETGYCDRYLSAFPPETLAGLTVGVFQHSAVGRDLVTAVLSRLGARCVPFGRSETFTAVDTEAIEAGVMEAARRAILNYRLDAVVSTDGDGDRPLVIDETGYQVTGDTLGALTAKFLGADTVVTPMTSTSAIELSGWFRTVERTKIGSPYVVEALRQTSGNAIVGFEANGGFLLQTPVALRMGTLAPLPTRDAMLPIIACLALARHRAIPVSRLRGELPERIVKAGRVRPVAPDLGKRFLDRIAVAADARGAISAELKTPLETDLTDGVRFTLADRTIVHFRQSGNAPELRCYVETETVADTDALLSMLLAHAETYLKTLEAS